MPPPAFPERVDVREVLRTVVAAVGDAVPRRGIAVHLGLPGEALTAEMCCDHFSKIVGQILGNAYQFAESRIDVTLEGPGGEVPGDVFRVRVRDDGAGIDRAEKARIFEPFYTSDKCVSGSGLGLGLAVAKSLAARMGAVLGVESAVGQWTEFTVTVPLGAPRPVPGSDGDSGVPAGSRPWRPCSLRCRNGCPTSCWPRIMPTSRTFSCGIFPAAIRFIVWRTGGRRSTCSGAGASRPL